MKSSVALSSIRVEAIAVGDNSEKSRNGLLRFERLTRQRTVQACKMAVPCALWN